MQTLRTPPNISSAWQKLKNREITCEEALKLLVDEQRVVNLDLLSDYNKRHGAEKITKILSLVNEQFLDGEALKSQNK
jgi:hypothetical protein